MQDEEYTYAVERWSPEMARGALRHLHEGQRKVDPALLRVFKVVWENGRWHPGIGAPIAFDTNGVMQNGAHRVTFISKLPEDALVPVLVFGDMPEWAIDHYDTGKNRSMGNFVKYAFPGYSDYMCSRMASVAGVLMSYAGPGHVPRTDRKQRPEVLVEWVINHHVRLYEATLAAVQIYSAETGRVGGITTARTLGFILYHLPESEEFFRMLASRTYPGRDPRQQMVDFYGKEENALPRGAQSRQVTLQRIADLLGCWDAFNRGRRWRVWDGEETTFRHPLTKHNQSKAA